MINIVAALLTTVLALPALAQPPRGGGERDRERPAERPVGDRPKEVMDVESLKNRIRDLEKQLSEAKGKKDGERKPEEKKPDIRKIEEPKWNDKKPEGRKPIEVQPQPFPPREGPQPQFGGGFPGGPPPQFGFGGQGQQFGGRGPGEGGNPFNPGSQPREGQPRPMGGGFGVVMSGGPGGGGVMSFNSFPGMDALNKDEQELFQKLMTKMRAAQQKPVNKPSVEERLERLEGMMQKLMQKMDR